MKIKCQAYLLLRSIFTFPIIRSTLKATVILLPLLGLTWVFGVLAIGNTSVFAWLFTICNSSQVCNHLADVYVYTHSKSLSFCCALYKLLQNSIHFIYASSSVWFCSACKFTAQILSLQGILILFFHVIRSEMVWGKIGQWFTTLHDKTLGSILRSQKSELVS